MRSLYRRTVTALLGGALLLSTGGCFMLPTTSAAPSSSPSEASPTPSETPSEEPAPEPELITCESVLDPATIAEFAGFGVVQNLEFAQKVHDEGNALALFDDNDGIICQWGFPNGAATMIYGYSRISYDDMIGAQNHAGGDLGATVSAYGGANLYSVPFGENIDGGPEYYLFGDDSDPSKIYWMYAYTTDILDQMLANIPEP